MQAEGKQLLTTAQVAGKPLVSFLAGFQSENSVQIHMR